MSSRSASSVLTTTARRLFNSLTAVSAAFCSAAGDVAHVGLDRARRASGPPARSSPTFRPVRAPRRQRRRSRGRDRRPAPPRWRRSSARRLVWSEIRLTARVISPMSCARRSSSRMRSPTRPGVRRCARWRGPTCRSGSRFRQHDLDGFGAPARGFRLRARHSQVGDDLLDGRQLLLRGARGFAGAAGDLLHRPAQLFRRGGRLGEAARQLLRRRRQTLGQLVLGRGGSRAGRRRSIFRCAAADGPAAGSTAAGAVAGVQFGFFDEGHGGSLGHGRIRTDNAASRAQIAVRRIEPSAIAEVVQGGRTGRAPRALDRPGFRLGLHAFQSKREAPHHGFQDAPAGRTGGRFVWYCASMVLTFRTAMLSDGEELVRVIRTAFTPYVRALGREFPADGSAHYAEERERFAAEVERGDVYVALVSASSVPSGRNRGRKTSTSSRSRSIRRDRAPASGAGCCSGSTRWRERAALAACRSRPPRWPWPTFASTSGTASRS